MNIARMNSKDGRNSTEKIVCLIALFIHYRYLLVYNNSAKKMNNKQDYRRVSYGKKA